MTKPSGTLEYAISLGSSGLALPLNVFGSDDVKGNRFGGQIPGTALIEAYVIAESLIGAGANTGFITVIRMPTIVGGLLTGLTITANNNDGVLGRTVNGTLYVRINHGENMAI